MDVEVLVEKFNDYVKKGNILVYERCSEFRIISEKRTSKKFKRTQSGLTPWDDTPRAKWVTNSRRLINYSVDDTTSSRSSSSTSEDFSECNFTKICKHKKYNIPLLNLENNLITTNKNITWLQTIQSGVEKVVDDVSTDLNVLKKSWSYILSQYSSNTNDINSEDSKINSHKILIEKEKFEEKQTRGDLSLEVFESYNSNYSINRILTVKIDQHTIVKLVFNDQDDLLDTVKFFQTQIPNHKITTQQSFKLHLFLYTMKQSEVIRALVAFVDIERF